MLEPARKSTMQNTCRPTKHRWNFRVDDIMLGCEKIILPAKLPRGRICTGLSKPNPSMFGKRTRSAVFTANMSPNPTVEKTVKTK